MFNARSDLLQENRYYQVIVEGRIDSSWAKWLSNFELVSRNEVNGKYLTTLTGAVSDQAALRGLVNRLWDLNLTLCSIIQIDPPLPPKME